MGASTEIAVYLIQNVGSLVLILIVFRGMLHVSRANFYNPISQMVVKLTNPLLYPLRRILPVMGRIDWAVIALSIILQSAILGGIAVVAGDIWTIPSLPVLVIWGAIGVLALLTNIYFFFLILMIIVSWVAPRHQHPAIELIWQISEPVMSPARALLPNMGGIDFSPILIFIGINVFQIALRHMAAATGLPTGLVMGI